MKRRIKQNRYGNWKGYVGNRRVYDFGTDADAAREWADGGELPSFKPENFKGNLRPST